MWSQARKWCSVSGNLDGLRWRKATASNQGNCVEVSGTSTGVFVRDTKNRRGPVLQFTHSEWQAFLTGVHGGEFTVDELTGGS
jgi:hypothetical protein